MAENEEKKQEEKKKIEKKQEKKQEKRPEEKPRADVLIRILSTDIPGNFRLYHGLTRIKGVSWAFSNAVCNSLRLDKNKKVSELNEKEIEVISSFIKSPKIPLWLLNRRNDEETGQPRHVTCADLDFVKEFDIRKMKKIKSYKGWRHAMGQPVRGQRTKSHFRHSATVGVIKSKAAPASASAPKSAAKKEAKK